MRVNGGKKESVVQLRKRATEYLNFFIMQAQIKCDCVLSFKFFFSRGSI